MAIFISEVGADDRYVSLSGNNVPPFTNWWGAARDIQTAVNASVDGDTVWVMDGTYLLSSSLSVTKGITVQSANGKSAIIDGGGVVRCFYISNSNAVMDGFTIQNGNVQNGHGGGVYCNAGTVQRCDIVGNTCGPYRGGGVFLLSGTVQYCNITSNSACYAGGVFGWNGTIVRNCVIAWNNGYPGWAGGVEAAGGTVEGCLVEHNNGTPYGSGITAESGCVVRCCTVVSNFNSAGIYCLGYANIQDSIICLNKSNWQTSEVGNAFSYCCTTPLPTGTGNITNDPLFVNAPAGNYRLSSASPCIDKGTNLAWMVGAADLDGNARILNGTVDMGAYEYDFTALTMIWTAVEVGWRSVAGTNYQVQWSTNLVASNWHDFGNPVAGNGGTNSVFDSTRTNAYKFYRVVVP